MPTGIYKRPERSVEHRKHLSESLTGVPLSSFHKEKMHEARWGEEDRYQEFTCNYCGKLFKAFKSRRKDKAFCSKNCSNKGKRTRWIERIKRFCQLCGKEFQTKKIVVDHGHGKFCSLKCLCLHNFLTMKKVDTKIEKIIESNLISYQVPFEKQKVILEVSTIPDFFIFPDLCIYVDGNYWHSLPKVKKRDEFINKNLVKNGYRFLRFNETEILESPEKCISKIKEYCLPF